jgi:hypothetical protein
MDVFYDHLAKEQQRIIDIIKRNIARGVDRGG